MFYHLNTSHSPIWVLKLVYLYESRTINMFIQRTRS